MGQYKFWIGFAWQFGFLIQKDSDSLKIELPFISIIFGLHREAHGNYIFGKEN